MSYQVLARKWRPRNFSEMAGQSHVLRTLIHALDNDRLHHAYLFTGTRGVGKTTIARILARCLNCEKGITSEPCGECTACREISEGRFLDLIEVDAASRTKVEDTRELLENVQYAPSRGRFKVYLIDEVHMLSTHSFNALLKTLEEPPAHVKFLLATTDPQKLPVTVLSRCLQFNLKNLSPEKLVEHLTWILTQEKLDFEEGALWLLGKAAQGSVRDCLTLLDQAIGFCDGKLTTETVNEFLGNLDQTIVIRLVDALAASDAKATLEVVQDVAEHSPDFAAVLQELQGWLHRVAIAQAVPDAIDNSQGDRDQILAHAAKMSAETVQLFYQIALKGREDITWALDARSGLEMTLLRMLAFHPIQLPDQLQQAQSTASGVKAPGESAAPVKKPEPGLKAAETVARADLPVTAPAGGVTDIEKSAQQAEVVPAAVLNTEKRVGSNDIKSAELAAPDGAGGTYAGVGLPETETLPALVNLQPAHWPQLFRALHLSGVTRSLASHCELKAVAGNSLSLILDEAQATLFSDEHRKRIETAMAEFFGSAILLTMTPGKVAKETPAKEKQRLEAVHMQQAVDSFVRDPLVTAIVERFGGQIQMDSITPLKPFSYDTNQQSKN